VKIVVLVKVAKFCESLWQSVALRIVTDYAEFDSRANKLSEDSAAEGFSSSVPSHGVTMIRISK
jgi:hypothetical protein